MCALGKLRGFYNRPIPKVGQRITSAPPGAIQMVGLGGFEPPTSPLSGVRSNQLSYRPIGRLSFLSKEILRKQILLKQTCFL